MSEGAKLIAAERERQVAEEGWTEEHDDTHEGGELALAAACYALNSVVGNRDMQSNGHLDAWWPWYRGRDEFEGWRPKDPIRDLVRAGALIAAEIDRLARKEPTP